MTEDDVFNALKYRTYDAVMKAYVWRNDAGLLHRDNGPAIEFDDGDKWWYQNGLRHRADGPAIEYFAGYKEWWIDGEPLSEDEFNKRTKPTEKTTVIDGFTYKTC